MKIARTGIVWLAVATLAVASADFGTAAEPAKDTAAKDTADKDYSGELPRIPRTAPADALATFAVEPGFRIEQVAAEPLVNSPVAMAFDENGRLFVVEMRDYSEDREQHLGRIRLLEDTNGDGRMDKSTIYVEGLPWPTAVACYDGGIFVGAAPDILYCKDTNGDGKSDEQRVVFTGFNLHNVQGLLNSFHWGLDNRIHGSASTCGGDVRPAGQPDAKPLSLRGQDFAIEPRSMTIAATSGGGQHGMSFDRWGNKFVASNSNHIQLVMFESRYIARNPYLAAPGATRGIAADGPAAEVFRTSPVEPWRVVRTRLRVSGVTPGIVEGGGRAAGYFTGATGVTIYRGDAWPAEYQGNAFIGDVGSNLVHRKTLDPDGVGQIARRATPDREFVTSRDIWFRPAQFANAPDGTLYIMDMSREVIEHPASLPPMIKKHLDLTSGRDQGRIYRVVPDTFKQPKPVKLGQAKTAQLVALLAHTNGWHRETAARLIYERQDKSAIPLLEKLVESSLPEGRMTALYSLAGLDALQPDTIAMWLGDGHPRVRQHAVRLAETLVDDPDVRRHLARLVGDDDPGVRYLLAFTLGELPAAQRIELLVALARRDVGDPWMRLALQSSLADGVGETLAPLAADEKFRKAKGGREFLESLARQVGAQNRPGDVAVLLRALPELATKDRELAQAIVRGVTVGAGKNGPELAKQMAAATGGKANELLAELVTNAAVVAQDADRTVDDRVEAIRSLAVGKFAVVESTLAGLVEPRQPQQVQVAAMSVLGQFDDPQVATTILAAFDTFSPRLRSEALEALLARPQRLAVLLEAIATGTFAPANIDPARAKVLLEHADPKIREAAVKTLGNAKLGPRSEVIDSYRDVLKLAGDAERGRQTFRKICAACHRLEDVGHEIGLNLATIRNRGPETILVNVLDPNREIDPRYINYAVTTDDGRSITGIIAAETATSITLKRAENATDTLLRINIEQLRSTGQSIMPEGFEKQIDKQSMADLIAYLLSIK